jgi:hypothetical protein
MHTRGLALVLALFAGGCIFCTEIFCEDQVAVTVSSAAPMPAGIYAFTFEVPDGVRAVTCTLAGTSASCTGDAKVSFSGAFFDDAFHFRVLGTPATLKVTMTRDATPVADQSFTPSYSTNQPNGPKCGPTCRQATASLQL